jgi:hypothetical protein
VVTGHDASGKAVALLDGAAANVKVKAAQGGVVSTLLWVTDESPADVSRSADRAQRDIGVAPPPRGSVFRVVDFPPLAAGAALSQEAIRADMGLSGQKAGRHPLMHRTKSIDYAIIMQGEIDMLLDDSEIHLKAGDVLVQQGTNHAWVNRGTQPCRIAFVLIDAAEPPQWKCA